MSNTTAAPQESTAGEPTSLKDLPPQTSEYVTPDFDKIAARLDEHANEYPENDERAVELRGMSTQLLAYAAGLRVLQAEERRQTDRADMMVCLAIGATLNTLGELSITITHDRIEFVAASFTVEVTDAEDGLMYSLKERG
jgi:hypothetical protein